MYQLEEEAGSVEEQPASNKADAYTIVKGAEQLAPFFLLSVSPMAKKTYSRFALSYYHAFLIRDSAYQYCSHSAQ